MVLSVLASTILLSVGLLYGPADTPERALVVGACSGSVGCALALFVFPGWAVFTAALASVVAGFLHQGLFGPNWPSQAALALVSGLAWVAAWWATRFCLESFGTVFEPYEAPWEGWEEAPEAALVRGGAFTLAMLGVMTPLLVWFLPSSAALAFPLAAGAVAWGCAAFPGVGLSWPLVGCLASPFLAWHLSIKILPVGINELFNCPIYPADLERIPPPDAWLTLGLLASGAVCGYWLTVWAQSLYYRPEAA